MGTIEGSALARAGSGVVYGYFDSCDAAIGWIAGAVQRSWNAVIEFAPEDRKAFLDLWPAPGGDLNIMKKVKKLFDPKSLLNRGRLYNRI
jgi:FAD/FMN-containing dehydrogenase